ncbi:MAG: 4Fe-4S dicluster domain-containing protein [Deltaproteobacteria bacterium]|nr:4Fe-4S dicluster domain-containing protein [Deltaproteobacteria bacterium]
MIKRPFFCLRAPRLKYPAKNSYQKEDITEIKLPDTITLLVERSGSDNGEIDLSNVKQVATGQKITLSGDNLDYFISTATGSIMEVCAFAGYMGKRYTSITIKTEVKDQWDDAFKKIGDTISAESALGFLRSLPGETDLSRLFDAGKPLNSIVINGVDNDLLVTTNQAVITLAREDLALGVQYLKQITQVNDVFLMIHSGAASGAYGIKAEIKTIDPIYPNAAPHLFMKKCLGRIIPAGMDSRDMGVGFINAEAVAALGRAFQKKEFPIHKILTIIHKDGSTTHARARIGTPIKHVLAAFNIEVRHGDQIILGGPMRGTFAYSEDMPVQWNTDAVMVQDGGQITPCEDTPCINCGECVRVCPAKIPVNMLVRLLENGRYEEGAEEYDLLSCIECGLCSYVCTARIPIFHYIMLGKYELGRIKKAEETNA